MLEKIHFSICASKNASSQLYYLQRLGWIHLFPWKEKEHESGRTLQEYF